MIHLIPSHQGRPSDDPIFALNREASERRTRGEPIVNATVGTLLDEEGRIAILPSAARAVREVPAEEWAGYAPLGGTPDFLRAVMDDLLGEVPELRDCAVAAATPGGTGALRHAIGNYLDPGQALLTSSYYWGPYLTLAEEADRRVETFSMFDAEGRVDVAAFDRALGAQLERQRRALVFLNDPCHNPTGYSMSADELRALVERIAAHAEQAPVTLLLDVAYADYGATNPRQHLPLLRPLLGRAGLAFAWSASKAFTHYGLRVGAIVACVPDPKERAMTAAAFTFSCRGTWSNCNRGGMRAVTRLLTDGELAAACGHERERLKALLAARVSAFNREARAAGLRHPRYEGGFFVTVFDAHARDTADAMRKDGIYVVPQQGALRVALCSVAQRDVPRLVTAMKR